MIQSLLTDLGAYFKAGGYVMPPLAIATLLLWYAAGYRFWALRRGSVRSVRVLLQRYPNGLERPTRGVIDHALNLAVTLRHAKKPHLRRYLDDAFSDMERDMRRFQRLISAIVTAAPLMGLLGTVTGMIETFDSLGDMTLFSQSGGIAGGISQALFTTQMGLAVAIPGLIARGTLNRKQHSLEMELAQIKDIITTRSADANPVVAEAPKSALHSSRDLES